MTKVTQGVISRSFNRNVGKPPFPLQLYVSAEYRRARNLNHILVSDRYWNAVIFWYVDIIELAATEQLAEQAPK